LNLGFSASVSITGILPSPPGAGSGHPFELRAGPFFGGELQVVTLRGRERVNDVYRYEVTFATDQAPEVVTSALFGMPACLTIKSPGHDPRVIQGLASSVEALGAVPGEVGGKRRRYRIEIVPRLWLLRHRRQNRIFQNKSVPDIVATVLSGVGIKDTDCRWRADKASYPALPFVYQRGETDYDFFRRILASAGIFFFYEHANGILDSMFGGAASAAAGALGAAAGMLGGAVASAVSTVESTAGMVPVLNFGAAAGHTAAVASAVGGLAADALQEGLGALGGALGGAAGAVVGAVAGAVEEPSDTLAFDDDMGADADYDRVYEFALKKELCTKQLRMLDRDVEAHASWVGVASVPDASASLNVSAGLSALASGGIAGAVNGAVSFDVDAPAISAATLRQEVYDVDRNVWHDGDVPGAAGPSLSLSAGLGVGGGPAGATGAAQLGVGAPPPPPAAPGQSSDAATAKRTAMELDRVRRKYQQAGGRSDCRRLGAGYRFSLAKHPVGMLNGEYTVTALDVEGTHPDFLGEGTEVYRNRFRCVPSSVAPRPKRPKRRPKPGMEVARVVGFVGGETQPGLEANRSGYVHVRFWWDVVDDRGTPKGSLELGTDDAYCAWLPIVQPWAGAGYGAQFIPRAGMDVLVGFMHDHSESPVILGCLYSDANPPPWNGDIDNQKVGLRSQSRPVNGGYSELSIDDRRGAEVLHVRAEKDMREDVLHDRLTNIRHDATATVGHDETLTVANDRTIRVGADNVRNVAGSELLSVAKNVAIDVIGDSTEHVVGNHTLTVDGSHVEMVAKNYSRTVVGAVDCVTEGVHTQFFEDDYVDRHSGHRVVVVGAANQKRSAVLHSEGSARASANDAIEVTSMTALILTCGKSTIRLTPEAITIATPKFSLSADDIVLAASDAVRVAGTTVKLSTSGASVGLDASKATVQAPRVQLGNGSGDSTAVTKPKQTTLSLVDYDGKPLANQRVLLRKGGEGGEERAVVLGADGQLVVTGDDPFDVHVLDAVDVKRG
jgi:type VI secretion system secreted protein VgrG